MAIEKVGVVGCGLMGAGIAQVCGAGRMRRDRARSFARTGGERD